MFTGIITNFGKVEALKIDAKKDLLIKISTEKNQVKRSLENGCSIACNGICLTLIKKEISEEKIIFSFQASKETCDKTNLKNWKVAQLINLEFALRVGDELGGHMVLGHVDNIAKVTSIKRIKDSHQFTFETQKNLMKFIAEKGSVTLDGISLTVNEVTKNSFNVNIIPHTFENTTFQNAKVGSAFNLEIDTIARYLQNYLKNDQKKFSHN